SQGRVIGHVEWPLTGSQTLDIQLSYDGTGTTPQSASLTYTSAAGSWPLTRDLTVGPTIDADLGPGHVQITLTPPAPPPVGLAAALPPSSAVFVFTGFTASVLNRSVFAASPADAGAALTVTVQDGADPLTLSVPPGATVRGSQDGLQVTAQRQGP